MCSHVQHYLFMSIVYVSFVSEETHLSLCFSGFIGAENHILTAWCSFGLWEVRLITLVLPLEIRIDTEIPKASIVDHIVKLSSGQSLQSNKNTRIKQVLLWSKTFSSPGDHLSVAEVEGQTPLSSLVYRLCPSLWPTLLKQSEYIWTSTFSFYMTDIAIVTLWICLILGGASFE